jgi:ligand-binding SRPBCC domain-containing protein
MITIKTEQLLPISLREAWDFFVSPRNLNAVTPKKLEFRITSDVPEKMYEGLIITYSIKPMLNIPVDWVTEITHIKELSFFVDEQRKGPYKMWHHEHHFKDVPEGVLMTDILYYDIGKSIFGWIAGKLFVHRKVEEIFDYRNKKLSTFFPAGKKDI